MKHTGGPGPVRPAVRRARSAARDRHRTGPRPVPPLSLSYLAVGRWSATHAEQADEHYPQVVGPRHRAVALGHLGVIDGMAGVGERLPHVACRRDVRLVVLTCQDSHPQVKVAPLGDGIDVGAADPPAGDQQAEAAQPFGGPTRGEGRVERVLRAERSADDRAFARAPTDAVARRHSPRQFFGEEGAHRRTREVVVAA